MSYHKEKGFGLEYEGITEINVFPRSIQTFHGGFETSVQIVFETREL